MDNQILIILCIFAALALLGYVAFMLLSDKDVSGRLRNRLVGKAKTDVTKPTSPTGVVPLLQKMGQAAAVIVGWWLLIVIGTVAATAAFS